MKLHVIYAEKSIEDLSKDNYQLTLTYDEWTELREILKSANYNFKRRLDEANIKRTSEWI